MLAINSTYFWRQQKIAMNGWFSTSPPSSLCSDLMFALPTIITFTFFVPCYIQLIFGCKHHSHTHSLWLPPLSLTSQPSPMQTFTPDSPSPLQSSISALLAPNGFLQSGNFSTELLLICFRFL